MDARAIIASLRRGDTPSAAALGWFARGLASGAVSDAQAGAFAMAVCLNGLGPQARAALTLAMRDSGAVLAWPADAPVIDKHSTGGVGDCVSLILAPALAACGGWVPMISGRGLGHTGGTLDKLEAIPGYDCDLSEARFRKVVTEVGCAIVAASGDLAPADRRLYAIRDEAAAVESVDLITASILSKKLAAGLDALVLDVKSGSGAFLQSQDAAAALAQSLVTTANAAGCRTSALITDMDQPLARSAGNALEVAEAVACLRGAPSALRDLTLALSAEALVLAGQDDADRRVIEALNSGRAAEIFARMVVAQGGPPDLIDAPDRHLTLAPVIRPIPAPEGFVAEIDATALGKAVVALGGGRVRAAEAIDHRVGLSDLRRLTEPTDGRFGLVHAASDAAADAAIAAVQSAFRVTPRAGSAGPLVRAHIAQPDGGAHNTRQQAKN